MNVARPCLSACKRGVAAVEFAILIGPLLVLLMASIEVGYRLYAASVMTGALRDAARMASTGEYSGTEIDDVLRKAITKFRGKAFIEITKKSYQDFAGVGLSEPITSGSIESGGYCYQDINGNGQWDADRGSSGLGNPDDVVHYAVRVKYDTLFPFTRDLLGLERTSEINANTLMSNEPFAPPVKTEPATRCA